MMAERQPGQPWQGFPTCYVCGMDYEPLTGDGDGQCGPCYNGVEEDETVADLNREGDPAFNGAFDKW